MLVALHAQFASVFTDPLRSNQLGCDFLCLPPELRNQIYSYVLGGNDVTM